MELAPEMIKEFVLAGHGDFEKIKLMLAENPALLNVFFRWSETDTETALEGAGHVGNWQIAEFLLEQGAPMNFYVAAMLGRVDVVIEYLRQDPSLATRPGVHGISALFHAALSGEVQIAELIAANGGASNPDVLNAALHGAVGYGHKPMVAWLLDHGATNINPLNFQQKTPLKVALERGFNDLADLLRECGGKEE